MRQAYRIRENRLCLRQRHGQSGAGTNLTGSEVTVSNLRAIREADALFRAGHFTRHAVAGPRGPIIQVKIQIHRGGRRYRGWRYREHPEPGCALASDSHIVHIHAGVFIGAIALDPEPHTQQAVREKLGIQLDFFVLPCRGAKQVCKRPLVRSTRGNVNPPDTIEYLDIPKIVVCREG